MEYFTKFEIFQASLVATWNQAIHQGFWATWAQLIDLTDPRGEINAYKVRLDSPLRVQLHHTCLNAEPLRVGFRTFSNGHANRGNVPLESSFEGQSPRQDKRHRGRKETSSGEVYGNTAGVRNSFQGEKPQATSK